MILPVKYKPVNWVDGMKISSNHFINTDLYIQDYVRDALSVGIRNFNYGVLPAYAGESSSFDVQISERATRHIEIQVKQCNAITTAGARIDISREDVSSHLSLTHTFENVPEDGKAQLYNILLTVNLFSRVPSGEPDPDEMPPRFPDSTKSYSLSVLPAAQSPVQSGGGYHLVIGQVSVDNNTVSVNTNYIPPCVAVISHQELIRYYEALGSQINELQMLSFKIIDKISSRESVSTIGKNVSFLCSKLLDHISQIFFSYRNTVFQGPPVKMIGYFSDFAHVFFTGIKSISTKEREELLNYFHEWRDVTPGNFEELLAGTIELIYDHKDIYAGINTVQTFMNVLIALWNKLSSLEFIGQHKENIVVAEQQLVQQVQAKRSWTLLD